MKEFRLTDLISPDILQQFQDGFSKFTGMAALITDENGIPVTVGSGFSDFCTDLTRSSEIGRTRCELCDKNGALRTLHEGKPAVYRCHAGLFDYASPIMAGGKFIGCIIGGQVRDSSIDRETMSAYAEEIGVDPDAYVAAAERAVLLDVASVEKAADFLYDISKILSEMAYANYIALKQSKQMEKAARSQSVYIMNMSINMEKNVSNWMSIAKQAVDSGDKNIIESSMKELIDKSSDVYSMVGDTVDYIRMAGGNVELSENAYNIRILMGQIAETVKESLAEKSISLMIKFDENIPEFLMGDPGKIGQIVNKLLQGCILFSDGGSITMKASCKKASYSTLLEISLITNNMIIPQDEMKNAAEYFESTRSSDFVIDEDDSESSLAVIAFLAKQMCGKIETEHFSDKAHILKFSIPQLEVRG